MKYRDNMTPEKAAGLMLAALKAALASPMNVAIPTTEISRNMRAAIAAAESVGITTEE